MSIRNGLLILSTHLLLFFGLSAQSTLPENVSKSENSKKYLGDIRIDPLLLVFQDVDISLEFFAGKNSSLEVMLTYITKRMEPWDPLSNSIRFDTEGLGMEFYYKYYFMPEHNYDGLFFSPYVRYRNIEGSSSNNFASMQNKRFALGMSGGFKYMITEKLSLELMLGLGYAISNSFEYSRVFNREPDFAYTNIDVIIRLPLAYRF